MSPTVGGALMVAWGVLGVAGGLFAANWVYGDPAGGTLDDRGFIALCAFVAVAALLPVVLVGAAVYGLTLAGAWLLPAYRAERRERRTEARRTEAETARLEIDKLHAQVGLPPVDWEARTP